MVVFLLPQYLLFLLLYTLLIRYFPSVADGPSLLIFRRRMRMQIASSWPVVGLVNFELHSPPVWLSYRVGEPPKTVSFAVSSWSGWSPQGGDSCGLLHGGKTWFSGGEGSGSQHSGHSFNPPISSPISSP